MLNDFFFMYCWTQLASILLRVSAYVFLRDIGLLFSSFVVSLASFVTGNADLIKLVWKYALIFNFLEYFEKDLCFFHEV